MKANQHSLVATLCAGAHRKSTGLFSRPFTGVAAEGGIRPGVYAGLPVAEGDVLSGPFTGLLLPGAGHFVRRPVRTGAP